MNYVSILAKIFIYIFVLNFILETLLCLYVLRLNHCQIFLWRSTRQNYVPWKENAIEASPHGTLWNTKGQHLPHWWGHPLTTSSGRWNITSWWCSNVTSWGRPHTVLYITPRDVAYQRPEDVPCRSYEDVPIWSNM